MKTSYLKVAALGLLVLSGTGAVIAHDEKPVSKGKMDTRANAKSIIASWPEASRMAAMDMIQKYGQPQEVTASMLLWRDNGPWKWTKVTKETIQHDFPMSHPDLLEQAINYRAPIDKYDDLARYDGSVIVERTKGEMSARCDKEGANFLAINLGHDVATGKKTSDEARTYYAAAIKRFVTTKDMDPYMQKLQFQPQGQGTSDPDRATM